VHRRAQETWMINASQLFRMRHTFLVASVASFVSCLYFIGLGAFETVHALIIVGRSMGGGEWANPGIILFEALDRFLIAVLFYIFGVGMIKLFTPELIRDEHLPKWLNVSGIRELKLLLWETTLVTLMVACVTGIMSRADALTWDALVLPVVIAVLALSLFLMRSKVETGGPDH
jgi:uncharacterized membrane protein YqhA